MLLVSVGVVRAAEPIIGRPSIADGDTLVIRDVRIRLHGIDAPESGQNCEDAGGKSYRCGQHAALALADHIGEAPVTCEPRDTDRYGRTVAVCRKEGEDLNAWMVSQGHAIAYRRYSEEYVLLESKARLAKRGIWAGVFEIPSDWRRCKRGEGVETRPEAARQVPEGPEAPLPKTGPPMEQAACQIKGNISAEGKRIYHLPGTSAYEKTRIDDASGERWFCSEDEAQKAGWRAPRR